MFRVKSKAVWMPDTGGFAAGGRGFGVDTGG